MEGEWLVEDWFSEVQFSENLFCKNPLPTWSVFPDDDPISPFTTPGDLLPVLERKDLPEPIIPTTVIESGTADNDLLASDFDDSEKAEHRRPISAQARCEMNQWVIDHAGNPFLSSETEEYFMGKYGLTRRQVKTAFNNRRQRIIAPSRRRMEEVQRMFQERFLTQLAALGMRFPGWPSPASN
jgi:hypothetical protein